MWRQKTREDWEHYHYSLEVTHDGKEWIITATAENPDPEIDEDKESICLPGWYTPKTVREIILAVNNSTNNCCTNLGTVIRPAHLESLLAQALVKAREPVIEMIHRVQGKVNCID